MQFARNFLTLSVGASVISFLYSVPVDNRHCAHAQIIITHSVQCISLLFITIEAVKNWQILKVKDQKLYFGSRLVRLVSG